MTALVDAPAPPPPSPAAVAAGLRADVLLRRPDVRAAEAELAAATASVGVEMAILFPTFTLVGGIAQEARKPGDLLTPDSTSYQLGPALHWPIFSAGRIRAQVRAAGARADQAAARYTKAVLGALADSETAIDRYAASQRELGEREPTLDESATAVDLAGQLYRAGETDRLALLEAQSAHDVAMQAAVAARQQLLVDYVALIEALGGDAH